MMPLDKELELDRPFSDLRHEAVLNVVHTANQFSLAAALLFRRFDLTEAQFNVLFALKYKTKELTQSALGKRLVVTRATITSVLDKLEGKGLVARKRVPGNRRIHHVCLTRKGRALIDKVEPLYRGGLHEATSDLSERECRALIRRLEQIRARTKAIRENADRGTL